MFSLLSFCILCDLQVQGGDYTHVLHGRYRDKAALEAYYAHADHVDIQTKLQSMTEDRLAVDWECTPCGPYIEDIGAKRITLLKIKNETSAEDMRFLEESIQLLPSKYLTLISCSLQPDIIPVCILQKQFKCTVISIINWTYAGALRLARQVQVQTFPPKDPKGSLMQSWSFFPVQKRRRKYLPVAST